MDADHPPQPRQSRKRRLLWWGLGILTVLLVAAAAVIVPRLGELRGDASAFPVIDNTRLTPTQQKIVNITREQYQAHHPGTFYAQGTEEPWCADFASWVMRSAGVPYRNPNSGSWRIPGVLTLRDYYRSQRRWHAPDSGYQPVVGDVVLYDGPPFGQHVNIVLRNDGGTLVTIGGNEMGAIRVHTHLPGEDSAIIGYGSLEG